MARRKRRVVSENKRPSIGTRRRQACDFYQAITGLPVPDDDMLISDEGEKVSMDVQIERLGI